MLGQILGSLLGSGHSGSGNTTSSSSSSSPATVPASSASAPAPIPAQAANYGADLPEETDDGVYSASAAPAAPEQGPASTSASTEEPAAAATPVSTEPETSPATASTPTASRSSTTAITATGSLGQAATVMEAATRLTRSSKVSGTADDGLSLEEAARKRAQEVQQQRSMRNLLNGAASGAAPENDGTAETEETGTLIVRHYYNAA